MESLRRSTSREKIDTAAEEGVRLTRGDWREVDTTRKPFRGLDYTHT